jgi:hypothetical protein
MRGDVSTANNGGLYKWLCDCQMKLTSMPWSLWQHIGSFLIMKNRICICALQAFGTWKFYRACFKAISDWQAISFSFSDLVGYKSSVIFGQDKLKHVGLNRIGRDFQVS